MVTNSHTGRAHSRTPRRAIHLAKAALALLTVASLPATGQAKPATVVWRFDNLRHIGGMTPRIVGAPAIVKTPIGKAMAFDGVDDAVYLDRHPLAGAAHFTAEAVFRPDGGAFAQRWMHLASDDPGGQTRMLFEIRVLGNFWYLDTFVKGPGYAQALIDPAKLHPIGRWYHVAQTYDGTTYRSYVDGVLEGEAKVAFTPQGSGKTSVGVRYTGVDFFHGAVRMARFAAEALPPSQFRTLRK
ncbi:LamG domain-containing protein [Novosphingobium sp. Leaf2]|uniref:LamG domain-containing protein n=1 Tax=Novosphingobium sp. Leaf2 TaxID=1735670 RepID=UPI0009ECA635|nr:LamG domain-containing protein [Novosphingobium sp. Leaf2]